LRAVPTPDDPTLHSVEFGPSLLVARSGATTTLDLPLVQRRRLDGSLQADAANESAADVVADVAAQLRTHGTVHLAGVRFEPVWTGSDERYHMYVRDGGATIGFAGAETDVPIRTRADGGSLLDAVWEQPVPQSRAAFLDRVGAAAEAARRDGLLAQEELLRVLEAAAAADVDGTGAGAASEVIETDAVAIGWSQNGGSPVRWTVPAAMADAPTL